MSTTHYFYLRLPVPELDHVVEAHKKAFDILLTDSFSDTELEPYEETLDQIAAIYVQPIISELTFDDLYPDPVFEEEQRGFFDACRSCICVENLPFLQSNPFQVTYLRMLLEHFDEVLIDQGGVSELVFKETYLGALERYKTIDALLETFVVKKRKPTGREFSPIDFMVQEIYNELQRLRVSGTLPEMSDQPERFQNLYALMRDEALGATALLARSCFIPKDFGDQLERLKFYLKKIP